MTTIDDLELDTNELEETRDAATPKNKSLIERLRAQRAEARPAPFDIVIPDWGADTGGLTFIARMRRIALDGAAARAAAVLEHALISGKPSTRELAAACDLLIAGLDELYVREPNAEEAVPLDADQPMKFTERTAELLGLEATKAREVVTGIFGGAVGQPRIISAAKSYYAWLSGVEVEDEGKA